MRDMFRCRHIWVHGESHLFGDNLGIVQNGLIYLPKNWVDLSFQDQLKLYVGNLSLDKVIFISEGLIEQIAGGDSLGWRGMCLPLY